MIAEKRKMFSSFLFFSFLFFSFLFFSFLFFCFLFFSVLFFSFLSSYTTAHSPDGCAKLGGVVLHELGDECLPSRTCHTANDQGSRKLGPSWGATAV